ncbi:NAD(P)-binding protein [Lindgomyces ingoldianus]|uniref:NAD(P)-binding protein n=1 Tax=Lindgomyces ingoldianus TaxID=673940 RepID=A0ACB6QPB4_9PLEO|nr:NAD(P)-binding protein [Lindgomyces ingoldianus]KAF2468819.1 NAD(P)-binding protein [Lindgomyces ingoldianus]
MSSSVNSFNPYAHVHDNPQRPGDQRSTAPQVVRDNDRIGVFTDKVVLVMGVTSGISMETAAKGLHATGTHVYITARNKEKAKKTVEYIMNISERKGRVDVIEMVMDSLESVKSTAKDFLGKSGKLNILVNNGGMYHGGPESGSKDGFEMQFAVNHLAHFALTALLLTKSSNSQFNSRVVFVSSSSHRHSSTTNHIDRLYRNQSVHALSLNPGGVWSELQKVATPEQIKVWKEDKAIGLLM